MSPTPANPKRWLVLIAVMLAILPIVLDMTVLYVAVPTMTQALEATNDEILWILDIYPLLMAGLLVPMGTLADRIGNRRLLLIGMTLFAIASAMAAFSPNAAMMIAARVLLALGGSMIMPCVLGIIRRNFEDEKERAMALGLWGMVGAVGAAIGPLIGGVLLNHFWWGSVFLINVPFLLAVISVCYLLLPRVEEATPGKWPIFQAILLIVGMISLIYGLKTLFKVGEPMTFALLALALGIVLLVLFVRMQLRSREPMLDLSLFSHPPIVAGITMAIVSMGALAGVELTLAQELQYVIGKTPLQAGIFMIPLMLAVGVGGPLGGYLSGVLGLRRLAVISFLASAFALVILAWSDFRHPGVLVPAMLAMLGMMLSIGLTASSIAIMSSVDASQGGAAGSLESTGYELGSGLGIAFFGVFMSSVFGHMIELPPGLAVEQSVQAARSIGDTFLVAHHLATGQAELIEAGKTAFIATHSILLLTAAALIAALAVLVFFMLANHPRGRESPS